MSPPPGKSRHFLCLVKGCPPPVVADPSQKRNAALFSGSLNNPGSLSADFMKYSRLAQPNVTPSDWVTKKYIVTPRFIEPAANNLSS